MMWANPANPAKIELRADEQLFSVGQVVTRVGIDGSANGLGQTTTELLIGVRNGKVIVFYQTHINQVATMRERPILVVKEYPA